MGPTVLSEALAGLSRPADPALLVGIETRDDAAVYRLSDDLAVISTADFITPPVDDPVWFGRIAAANSLSDVYAMGGRPIMALSLVMFPAGELDVGQFKDILRGGEEKVREAGASMAGGHSVDDIEPKYGLAVTGLIHPGQILTNSGGRMGDILVLTKPLGTGVLFNACRARKLPYGDLLPLLPSIAALNKTALEVARGFDPSACTDVTGFGIAGHALEMAEGCGLGVRLDYSALPVYPHAKEMFAKGVTTNSNKDNRLFARGRISIMRTLSANEEELLYDPQTSGGLLIAVAAPRAHSLVEALAKAGIPEARIVGEIMDSAKTGLTIT